MQLDAPSECQWLLATHDTHQDLVCNLNAGLEYHLTGRWLCMRMAILYRQTGSSG